MGVIQPPVLISLYSWDNERSGMQRSLSLVTKNSRVTHDGRHFARDQTIPRLSLASWRPALHTLRWLVRNCGVCVGSRNV
jgi:hypothetical protein